MALCVVDASFMLSWSLDPTQRVESSDVLERIIRNGAVAPVIWPLEIANGLVMAERHGKLKATLAYELTNLMNFPIEIDRRSVDAAWFRTVELARRYGLTAYDAAYLELATRRASVLVTLDRALAKAGREEGLLVLPT